MFGVLITVLNLIDVISLHDPVREVKRTQKELRKLQRFINLTCYSTLSPLQDTIYISFLICVNGPSNWYKVFVKSVIFCHNLKINLEADCYLHSKSNASEFCLTIKEQNVK